MKNAGAALVASLLFVGGCSSDDLPMVSPAGCWPDARIPASDDLAADVVGRWVGIQNAAPVYSRFWSDGTVRTDHDMTAIDGVWRQPSWDLRTCAAGDGA